MRNPNWKSVSIPRELMERLEKVFESTTGYKSVAEMARTAIRELVEKYENRA